MINPVIISKSKEESLGEEGCLSVPDIFADVKRACEVEVQYTNLNGELQTLKADGFLAVCVQHELDHLDGILFYKHLSSIKRNIIIKKLKKLKSKS
jgi:peptide deformylase